MFVLHYCFFILSKKTKIASARSNLTNSSSSPFQSRSGPIRSVEMSRIRVICTRCNGVKLELTAIRF